MPKILIIDDDAAVRELLSDVVTRMGNCAQGANNLKQGLSKAKAERFDLVLLDVGLPDGNGLSILPQLQEIQPSPEIIIITGDGDPDAAELAIKNGAWDYLVKPSSVENIMLTIQRALTYRNAKLQNPRPKILKRDEIIGKSRSLNATLERTAQAAETDANVLISGETGTGKELFARAVHENSARCQHPFVVVDCAALPETLVESVLFGHTKGAFTGADKDRLGLIRQAHGGTLFLDEVGELPLSLQKAFLRVIQERCFRPVSGHKEIKVNFRLIAATNRDLDAMVTAGTFRSDLLFRLRTFSIETPPLRRRKGDIRRLSLYYVGRLCEIYQSETKGFSADFLDALAHYSWPGNVRELFNTLEEAISSAGPEPSLHIHHLPVRLRATITRQMVKKHVGIQPGVKCPESELPFLNKESFTSLNEFRDKMECRYLERLNQLTQGNRKEACRISGLSRTRLFELLKKHGLGQQKTCSAGCASMASS